MRIHLGPALGPACCTRKRGLEGCVADWKIAAITAGKLKVEKHESVHLALRQHRDRHRLEPGGLDKQCKQRDNKTAPAQ